MTDDSRTRASAAKRRRQDDELQLLAATFSEDWRTGDKVQTWLRLHEPRLTSLVRDRGWSWEDVGRAMALAGIAYSSGQPISGPLLWRKVSAARTRRAGARKTAEAPTVSRAEPSPPIPVSHLSVTAATVEPKFKLVRAARPVPLPPAQVASAPVQPEPPQRSREEVLALLRGETPTDKP